MVEAKLDQYIKYIELHNFKSYKGTHRIGTFKNYTCVIGPNGSGKSNLMDAISFVMGLNASNLRTSKLQNLVYNGGLTGEETTKSKSRKAHVKVVFMNKEEEIEFKRRIENGKSIYSVNGKTHTEEAYRKELETYRIYPKAKNFLVFQGDVSSIASKNPQELTTLIEHVSGSGKLKKKYEELKREHEMAADKLMVEYQKKKNATQEKKKLAAALKDATEYNATVEELTKKQAEYVLWRLYHIEAKIQELAGTMVENEKEQEEYNKNLEELGKQIAPLKAKSSKLRAEIAQKRAAGVAEKKKETMIKSKLMDIEAKIQHLTQRKQKINLKTTQNEKEQQIRNEKKQRINTYISKAEEELKALKEEEDDAEKMTDETKLKKADLEKYQQLKRNAGLATFSQQSKLDSMQSRMVALTSEKESIADQRLGTENEVREVEGKLKVKKQKINDLELQVKDAKEALQPIEDSYNKLKQSIQEHAATKLNNEQKLEKIRDSIQRARFEQEEESSQKQYQIALENIKRNFTGVYGAVKDFISPSTKKFSVAVQVAIGNKNAYSIVVDTTDTAFEVIQYLKDQRLPEVTIIPMDGIRVKKLNESLRTISENAKLVYDVITVQDPALEKVVRFCVGNTVLFPTIDEATDVCFEQSIGYKIRAVTLDGTLINKNGTIIAGLKEVEEQLDRSKSSTKGPTMEVLSSDRDTIMESLRHSMVMMTKAETEAKQLEVDRARHTNTVEKYEFQLGVLKEEIKHDQELLVVLQEKLTEFNASVTHQEEMIETCKKSMQDLQEEISRIEEQIFGAFVQEIGYDIRAYERQITEKRISIAKRKSELNITLSRLRSDLAYVEGEEELATSSLQDTSTIDTELESLTKQREQESKRFDKIQESVNKSIEIIKGIKEQLKEVTRELNETNRKSTLCQDSIKNKMSRQTHVTNLIKQWRSKRESILRQCDLDDISIPLESLDSRPSKKKSSRSSDPSSSHGMEDDSEFLTFSEFMDPLSENFTSTVTESGRRKRPKSIRIVFSSLHQIPEVLNVPSQSHYKEIEVNYHAELSRLEQEKERLAPSIRGSKRLQYAESEYDRTMDSFEKARSVSQKALSAFEAVKEERASRFKHAFKHISENIDQIYKNLTKSTAYVYGGTAVLSLEDSAEPYLAGLKYNVMPPLKRFHYMDQLSGGERTVAALALLFAIHHYKPSPFFVLDEIDAALDYSNVAKVSNYIQVMAARGACQFIVISLKDHFFSMSDRLVGICKDHQSRSSMSLHFDLESFPVAS